MNQEKTLSPSSMITLSRDIQSRCPENSTTARATRKLHGRRFNLYGFLDLADTDYGGIHLSPLF
jgi:hypothetical protein